MHNKQLIRKLCLTHSLDKFLLGNMIIKKVPPNKNKTPNQCTGTHRKISLKQILSVVIVDRISYYFNYQLSSMFNYNPALHDVTVETLILAISVNILNPYATEV